ncbi:hypothetical protein RHSIM_Rhsim05G0103300 [Rhododendron simsii]|uniref:GTP cyclohydrolase II n=1 Tax=Rhododendron simsii TaxID=118357 RepID=A0A834LQ42_RHOSS|nr:hypothetical protein RHSIM_Rhsim05G0103300 [Rhododendron simsii]
MFSGLHCMKLFPANRCVSDVSLIQLGPKSFFNIRSGVRIKATLLSGEGDLRSHHNGTNVAAKSTLLGDLSTGIEIQPDSIALGTLAAETTPTTIGFPSDNGEFDLDLPTKGFSSIPEAIEDIRQGKMVVVVDDEDRENEGDLIMAASKVTPEAMAFFVKHGTGIVCVSMNGDDLERLELPLMVASKDNEEKLCTAFTVTVDAKHGTTTGVSANDRATTVLALASKDSKPEDFNRPGHIFPLKYREGGVLKRAGHTEASVDLAVLAGFDPVAVICEVVDDDGSMARLPKLQQFALSHDLKIVSIADLISLEIMCNGDFLLDLVLDGLVCRREILDLRWIASKTDVMGDNLMLGEVVDKYTGKILKRGTIGYRRKRDKLVERSSAARIPTMWGPFTAYCYKSVLDGIEHIAMVKGEIGDGQDILVRVHSECLTGDIFGSARCDCGNQLALAMQQIEAAGKGVLVYLRGHEGRGIGLGHKLRAYNLQDDGRDTVEANEELGLPVDSREYGIGAQVSMLDYKRSAQTLGSLGEWPLERSPRTVLRILRDLGVRTMKLMTNNPAKYIGLKGYGLAVSGRVPLLTPITMENKRYLETKRAKMGHVYGLESDMVSFSPGDLGDVAQLWRFVCRGVFRSKLGSGSWGFGGSRALLVFCWQIRWVLVVGNNFTVCGGCWISLFGSSVVMWSAVVGVSYLVSAAALPPVLQPLNEFWWLVSVRSGFQIPVCVLARRSGLLWVVWSSTAPGVSKCHQELALELPFAAVRDSSLSP